MTKKEHVIVDREVSCTLRDGIRLYANIYRPQEAGAYPTLLTRLPYNKNLPDFSHRYIDPIRLAMDGYVVIIQDVRGRFASEGEFEPFAQEGKDGYDAVEWAATLPYSNGKVGMFGLSYYAYTQLYAMVERPPALKAIFPAMVGNIFKEAFGKGGVLELASAETWMLDSIASDYLKRKQERNQYNETIKEITNDLNQIEEWHGFTPIKDWPPVMKHTELHEIYSNYMSQVYSKKAIANVSHIDPKQIDIPAYHLAGWYDNFLGQTLTNYQEMSESNDNQKLMIGPWGHGMFYSELGEQSFGVNASGASIDGKNDITSLHNRWFDQWLKNKDFPLDDQDPIKIFVMGTNEWRTEKEWPLKRTQYTPYYFHSDGQANTTMSSGSLTIHPPVKEKCDHYTHDPEIPVRTNGGGILFYNGKGAGPRNQRVTEEREDVLVYTSAPLHEALEVTGWVKVILWVSTDAPDTDFSAKLVDVFPDGRAYNLTDGIVRAKYRHGKEKKASMNGEIIQLEIDLWATSNVFLPGHAIRIDIASSDFPRYDVNPNTGDTTLDTVKVVKAKQTVYHQTEYPSHVLLPVIPK
ncbi:CocE/NonD family hydrolase [Paraliobacillus sediminis]|uniref:CocE/NonD family hydrolase n=1 Tax=Paraliobacillus sediminis TaxID=1885916 RepID=UPI000E3E6EA0|nr:CocE/NonD family hydrolase [Paraliobacillus sediminis]